MAKQLITACAFLHKNKKLFLAKRADIKVFLPGKYELPGGHVDFGESLEQGLKREWKEEFGADIAVGRPIYAFTYINESKKAHVVEIVFLAALKDDQQKIVLNSKDHSSYAWIEEDEIDDYYQNEDLEKKAVIEGFKIIN
jgi:8-oxo-dGTP diphosphatase